MRIIRLQLWNVRPHRPEYGLIGAADVGCAIDNRNKTLADELAAALRRAGYESAHLMVDGDEVQEEAPAAGSPTEQDVPF